MDGVRQGPRCTDFRVEAVADGLVRPFAMAFTPGRRPSS